MKKVLKALKTFVLNLSLIVGNGALHEHAISCQSLNSFGSFPTFRVFLFSHFFEVGGNQLEKVDVTHFCKPTRIQQHKTNHVKNVWAHEKNALAQS